MPDWQISCGNGVALTRRSNSISPRWRSPPRTLASGPALAWHIKAPAARAEALEAFRQAVSSDPENAFAQYHLGLASLEAKRFDEALTALRAASLKDPLRPEVFLALGRLYTARNDKTEALQAFRHCLRLDPLNTSALKAVEELSATLYGSGSSPQAP